MWTQLWIIPVLAVVLKSPGCSSYSSGAPRGACISLTPRHRDNRPQGSSPPYRVAAYEENGDVRVSISHSPEFQGFVIQARSNKDKDKIVEGTFRDEQDVSKTVDCAQGKKNTLTHTNPKPKRGIDTVWTPAPGTDEDVIFRASVAKSYDTFWINIDSAPIRVRRESSSGEDGAKSETIDYTQCGVSKGCFGFPSNCHSRQDCDILVSYSNSTQGVFFTMEGSIVNDNDYIATGLSADDKMGDDSVMECFIENGMVAAQESWNRRRNNLPIRKENSWSPNEMDQCFKEIGECLSRICVENVVLTNEEYRGIYQNGIASCSWTRSYDTTINGNTFSLLNSTYYILIAKGQMEGQGIGYHTAGRLASSEKLNFTAFEYIGGAGVDPAIKIHGETSTSEQPASTNANPPTLDVSTQQPVTDENSPGMCSRTTMNILLLSFSVILLKL